MDIKDEMLEAKTTGKSYEIDSLDKLVNVVNKDNFERLATDFLSWLAFVSRHYESLRELHPEICEGKTNTEIGKATFIWTDDGIEGLTGVQFTNSSTGEQKKVDFEDPKI